MCWPVGRAAVPFLRFILRGLGTSSQRADHLPGLLQPTGMADGIRAHKKGTFSVQEGPACDAIGAPHSPRPHPEYTMDPKQLL